MTHHTDPDAIEREIERERASLAYTLDELSGRVSPDGLAREPLGTLRSNAATYTKSIDAAVRSNPLAVALAGVGIAWLIFGSGSPDRRGDRRDMEDGREPWHPAEGDWRGEADSLRDRAVATLRQIEDDARRHYADLRDGLADRYSQARDFASERREVVAGLAADLRRTLGEGLDDLSDAARERVIAARQRAYSARLKAEQVGRRAVSEPVRLIEENPVAAGAVALALGAALGAALPRTRGEDRAFGAESDRLFDEAARLLQTERQRAMRVAQGVGEELREVAAETAGTLSDKAGEAADRVKARAREEARPRKASGAAGT